MERRERTDTRVARPARLPIGELKRLSRISPTIMTLHIISEWAQVIGAAWLCWTFFHPLGYVVCVAYIGARQQSLLVLMHEGVHRRLYGRAWLNEWVAEAVLAWPFLFLTMAEYRVHHLLHHRHANTPRDPDWLRKQTADWDFPQRPARLARTLLVQLSGLGFVKLVRAVRALPPLERPAPTPRARALRRARPIFLAACLGAVTALGLWPAVLLFWLVPMVTWLQVALHVRSIAEHFPLQLLRRAPGQTRTTRATWLDRGFLGVKDASYHLEHHLYPSVPFYRLAALHRILMRDRAYARQAHLTRGYWGVLRECVTSAPENRPRDVDFRPAGSSWC